jgi:hypothetical protein
MGGGASQSVYDGGFQGINTATATTSAQQQQQQLMYYWRVLQHEAPATYPFKRKARMNG